MYYLYDFYQDIQDAVNEVTKANSTLDKFLNESIKFIRVEQVCRIFCYGILYNINRGGPFFHWLLCFVDEQAYTLHEATCGLCLWECDFSWRVAGLPHSS